ncbi:metalloregulator ArsR/SmtB family transcription factor [Paenibacillus sp. N1-5-1-14]|uniref:metalloregulator ArsR/SmtB family transcription factor n=1 Tax=Paenibacillus radicibacter TaxID=2972488 RepID=UPI002159A381|nr:metalloregulator ArsR/SmtB family transcription factor [Paenibacillus radicibacter]MCR8643776.1 metalloregulator ArsR/SmtB family transcription factor [Paenibacillus radicibacter]
MTDIYRAIADPIRRKILHMVARAECTQSDIVAAFSISQPAIKKHLAILQEEQLLLERKQGKYCYYRLNTPVYQHEFSQLQRELGLVLEKKLAGLKHFLEEEQ